MTQQLTPYAKIDGFLRTKEITGKLKLALGNQEDAFKYIGSVLSEIQKSMSDPKKDLSLCSPDSIGRAIVDAASFKLPIDGRGYAHLVKYGNTATFQVGYKGLIAKISEVYQNVNFTAEIVFKDDELSISDVDGYQAYTHKKKNPFESNQVNMIGVLAVLQYENHEKKYQKIVTMPKSEVDQIRKTAKQDFIWSAWYYEKAKVAALKRLCKINFATVMGLQELIAFDNHENHELEPKPVANDINKIIENELEAEYIDVTPIYEEEKIAPTKPIISPEELEILKAEGHEFASEGVERLQSWWKSIGGDKQKALGAEFIAKMKVIATEADGNII
jgi:recombination protein RecT